MGQEYLQMLKQDIEGAYLCTLPVQPPTNIAWADDTWLDLAAAIGKDIRDNSHKYPQWVLRHSSLFPQKDIISDKTLKRIFQSGETNKYGKKYPEYNVEEPIRPVKRRILDILSLFAGWPDWQTYILDNSQINEIWSTIRKQVDLEFNSFKQLPYAEGNEYLWEKFTLAKPGEVYSLLGDHYNYLILFITFECTLFLDHGCWFNNPGNKSTYEIVNLSFVTPITSNGLVTLIIGIVYNLELFTPEPFKFVEEATVQTEEWVTLEQRENKWHVTNVVRRGGRLKCSWYDGRTPGPEDLI